MNRKSKNQYILRYKNKLRWKSMREELEDMISPLFKEEYKMFSKRRFKLKSNLSKRKNYHFTNLPFITYNMDWQTMNWNI